MADYTPTGRQVLLLSKIAMHIAINIDSLTTGNVHADLNTSLDLIQLTKEGLVYYSLGDRVVRCTAVGRMWVSAHERYVAGERRVAGGGH